MNQGCSSGVSESSRQTVGASHSMCTVIGQDVQSGATGPLGAVGGINTPVNVPSMIQGSAILAGHSMMEEPMPFNLYSNMSVINSMNSGNLAQNSQMDLVNLSSSDEAVRAEFNSQHNKGLLRHMSDTDLYHQMKFSQTEASQRLGVSISTLKRELHRRGIHIRWPYPKRKTKKDSISKHGGKLQEMRERISINLLVNDSDIGEKSIDWSGFSRLLRSIREEKRKLWSDQLSKTCREDYQGVETFKSNMVESSSESQNSEAGSPISPSQLISESENIRSGQQRVPSYVVPPPISIPLPPLPGSKRLEVSWTPTSASSHLSYGGSTPSDCVSSFSNTDPATTSTSAASTPTGLHATPVSSPFTSPHSATHATFGSPSNFAFHSAVNSDLTRKSDFSHVHHTMQPLQTVQTLSRVPQVSNPDQLPQLMQLQHSSTNKVPPPDKAFAFFTRRNSADRKSVV